MDGVAARLECAGRGGGLGVRAVGWVRRWRWRMKATVEEREGKQVSLFGRNDKHSPKDRQDRNGKLEGQGDYKAASRWDADERWAKVSATAGAGVWAGIAVLGRMGIARVGAIELLFLFAPLVIVPLGMELGRVIGGVGWMEKVARRVQPAGAGLAVVAIWLPPGRKAGALALGWLGVCLLMAGGGATRVVRALWTESGDGLSRQERTTICILGIAQMDLAVGGAWLVASRLGMRPMGIQEPIGLLTAVHFHFAGFATATIAAATLAFAERRGLYRWVKPLVWMVAGMPYAVACGFVVSPALKTGAAVLFSASVAGLAIAVRGCGKRTEDAMARMLLQIAAGAIFAGMVLSAAYAIADFRGSDALTIPQMARTHGILNAGFCMAGLLGWLVEEAS